MAEKNQDLGITQKQDGSYWDISIPDLDASTDYAVQFAWVYSDTSKGVSDYSDFFEFTTPSIVRSCPINVIAVWNEQTADLNITWEKPFATDGIARDDRIKLFQLTLFANDLEIFIPIAVKPDINNYSYTLSQQNNMANFGGEFQVTIIGRITSIYGDGSSDDCLFDLPTYLDPICTGTIADEKWSVVSIDNGILVSWNDDLSKAGTYRETRVYVSETIDPYSWDLRYTGFGPASIVLDTLAEVYVKVNHLSDSGCQSIDSSVKTGKAFDPIQFDDDPPVNDFELGTAVVTDDSNGLFSFDKKVLFTWTQNSDEDTAGYRIRFRIANTTDPYTFMSVPGKEKTSTYLYGLKGGKTYEIAVSTFDIYGNTNESDWKTYPNVVAPISTSLLPDVAITAGDMKLGYGIGGDNAHKGLYIAPDNYWYVQGNTNVSSAARLVVGGSTDKLIWDGANLSITGTVNANAGKFTGSIDIGTSTVDGQFRIAANGGTIEMGKYTSSITGTGITPTTLGIQVTAANDKYVQLDTINGIIATKGTIAGWTLSKEYSGQTLTGSSINYGGNVGLFAPANTPAATDIMIWAGTSRLGTPGPNFSVTYSGALTANEATIRGSIEAREGYFGTYNVTTKTITDGWKINGKFLQSFSTAFSDVKVKLDGLQGTVAGGNIVGSNVFFWNPTSWYATYDSSASPDANLWNPEEGSGSGNPGNIDYISSTGNFRLANGNLTYNGNEFKVKTDLVASNVFIGATKTFSNDYILGKNTTIDTVTKNAGDFSLGGGIMTGTSSSLSLNGGLINIQATGTVETDSNNFAGDPTLTLNSSGQLVKGRRFLFNGTGNVPINPSTNSGSYTWNPTARTGTFVTNGGDTITVKAGDIIMIY